MPGILLLQSELNLHTRCENQIDNCIDRRPVRAGDTIASEDFKRKYKDALHRPVAASRKYNCHGLTFASRRTWIDKPTEVQKILTDDDYRPVDLNAVLPGDVAIYKTKGVIEHSGVVVKVVDGLPVILSKWAALHEAVHRARDCPYYDCDEIQYYRIST
jgi:hypothetical protein